MLLSVNFATNNTFGTLPPPFKARPKPETFLIMDGWPMSILRPPVLTQAFGSHGIPPVMKPSALGVTSLSLLHFLQIEYLDPEPETEWLLDLLDSDESPETVSFPSPGLFRALTATWNGFDDLCWQLLSLCYRKYNVSVPR